MCLLSSCTHLHASTRFLYQSCTISRLQNTEHQRNNLVIAKKKPKDNVWEQRPFNDIHDVYISKLLSLSGVK